MSTNLWPDFDVASRPRTVKRILREAGNGIAEKTANLIEFVVFSTSPNPMKFDHECYLNIVQLGFRYPLLKVYQGPEEFPVKIVADLFPQNTTANNEAELVEKLAAIFQSEETKQLVNRLIDAVA